MSLRDDLLRAGVPEQSPGGGALDADRVERNIAMAQPARMKVRVEGDKVVFETLVGRPRGPVEVPVRRLWDPAEGPPFTANELREQLKPLTTPSKDGAAAEDVARARELGASVGVDLETLTALVLVEGIRGFGPQKFKELHEAGVSPGEVAEKPELLPTRGKRGDNFRAALAQLSDDDRQLAQQRAARQIVRAEEHGARVLTFGDPLYPHNVRESNNPVPVLYARGNPEVLRERRAVACVGSRKIRPPYAELQRQFAETAARAGVVVVSGFALGADTLAHEAAHATEGRTIAVMPSGLDRPFPPENRPLWDELVSYDGAVFVSEFPFGTAASTLTLRKRNKLIVAFAEGVLVGQSSATGGAMNAYRFAREQRKPAVTFASDGTPETSGNALIVDEAQQRQAPMDSSLPAPPTFPDHPDPDGWKLWLQALSSST
jgi:DNA protecting protein DprA